MLSYGPLACRAVVAITSMPNIRRFRESWNAVLRSALLPWTAAVLLGAADAHAQEASSLLNDATRRAVVDAAADALRQRYVFPDVGNRAALAIETALAAGRYDGAQALSELAQRLTDDLRDVTQDKHLLVSVSNLDRPASASATPRRPPFAASGESSAQTD